MAEDAVSWASLRPEMVAWVRALGRAGVTTAILSNMHREVWAEIERCVDWLESCASVTLSFEVGAVKPEPEIYLLCLARLGAEPGSALFVDDPEENVDAAAALGMNAIRFESPEQLDRELRAAFDGVLPPITAGG